MEVKVILDLDILKQRLCPDCKEEMDKYLKELAVAQLLAESKQDNGK